MKYSDTNPPLQCFMNQSNWMKGAVKNGTPVGILWHDTAAGNSYIKRYVQPDDNAPDRNYWLEKLGVNPYGNDWNHSDRDAGVNCFVGRLANDEVTTVQVGPWTTHAWGCGGGDKGSCNGYTKINGKIKWVPEFWIQFEMCDDNYQKGTGTKEYFLAAYKEACEITAYLCKKFNIDPKGTVEFNGVKVPTILCHYDSYKLGLGSGHGDVYKWFGIYGYTMDNVREDVAKLLGEEPGPSPDIQAGDLVSIKDGAKWWSGSAIPSWVKEQNWYVLQVNGKRAVLDANEAGTSHIMSPISIDNLVLVKRPDAEPEPEPEPELYRVRKSWADKKSQIGAYHKLELAIKECDKAGYGYSVFNSAGESVYFAPAPIEPTEPDEPEVPEQPDIPEPPVEQTPSDDGSAPTTEPEPDQPDQPVDPVVPDQPVDPTEPTDKEVNWIVRLIKALIAALKRLFGKN